MASKRPVQPSGPHRVLLGLNRILCHTFHRVNLLTPPPSAAVLAGGGIIAPNHTSSLDPLLVQSVLAVPIRWMMAKEYLETPGLGWLFRAVQVIPVNRTGQDLASTRAALRALRDGEVLGIFPEGKIETSREMLPLAPGIAYLAAQARTRVIPVWIEGTQRRQTMVGSYLMPQEANVAFGRPIDVGKSDNRSTVVSLIESQYRMLKTFSAREMHLTHRT
jgi:1-acyl-sn-glycerol-3-phosphate acyltransferase